ncbi:MAG: hypothetical protein ACRERD_28115 [Candidatus Binatia bacterium]
MQHETLATIAGTSPDTRLEVVLDKSLQDEKVIELRRLAWGKGIGWYCQQTLRLESTEAEALLQALRQSRSKWGPQSARPTGKIIPFPTLGEQQERPRRQTA